MNFIALREKIKKEASKRDFESSSGLIQDIIFNLTKILMGIFCCFIRE
jgi:hypothetical protein